MDRENVYNEIQRGIRELLRMTEQGKVFNDPIHGHMKLHPLLIKIIDTPQFQRLRNIKQLGGAYFVYPGASHNRFEHSIGVAHLAGELVKALSTRQPELLITARDILCVQIAGLCHDLGHGPFSHLYDGMFIPEARRRKDEKRKKWRHEDASLKMFDHLVTHNDLDEVMENYGLVLPDDQIFIKEMIAEPLKERQEETQNIEDGQEVTDRQQDNTASERRENPNQDDTASERRDSQDQDDTASERRDSQDQDNTASERRENPNQDNTASEGAAQPGAQPQWSYKGRPKEKSFLYEIVANQINSIDVDKFDYFARDCHHLGIQNNFDHLRYFQFARVCEVDGQKQICSRDKEVNNLYELFHTRYSLHRRAYQHNVNKIVEFMIAEAFVKADRHIQIKGSGGTMCTLSTAIDDMEAYTKLTDCVFEKILNSTDEGLEDARKILSKIVSRNHYKLLAETKCTPGQLEAMIQNWKMQLRGALKGDGLEPQDFVVLDSTMNYGRKDRDPIENVYFYSKRDPHRAFHISRDRVSNLLPTCFSETLIRVHCKKTDEEPLKCARERFRCWCSDKGLPVPPVEQWEMRGQKRMTGDRHRGQAKKRRS